MVSLPHVLRAHIELEQFHANGNCASILVKRSNTNNYIDKYNTDMNDCTHTFNSCEKEHIAILILEGHLVFDSQLYKKISAV